MTKKEKKAIKMLEDALMLCGREGIRICGMDRDIYYATLKARNACIKEWTKSKQSFDGEYCLVAFCQNCYSEPDETGCIRDPYSVFEESGGW